jgi:hypothetical protein
MSGHDLAAKSEADSSTWILLRAMEAAKEMKDPFEFVRLNANAVVPHGKDALLVTLLAGNVNARGELSAEFDRVGEKVLKELNQLDTITFD